MAQTTSILGACPRRERGQEYIDARGLCCPIDERTDSSDILGLLLVSEVRRGSLSTSKTKSTVLARRRPDLNRGWRFCSADAKSHNRRIFTDSLTIFTPSMLWP